MSETLALRTARRHLQMFSDESAWMKDHHEAAECRDCEAFIQLGIDAFDWLIRADERIRDDVYEGKLDFHAGIDSTLEQLFSNWLKTCELANEWIQLQTDRGFDVDNLVRFKNCDREVRAIVKSFDENSLSEEMEVLRDQALIEFDNGETAEFI